MKKNCNGLVVIGVWLLFAVAMATTSLSDDQKRDAVYQIYAGYQKEFPMVVDISASAARVLAERAEVVFIDVRKPAEMAVSMLPKAVDKEAFLKAPEHFAEKTLVAYCTVGYRSGVFAREMADRKLEVRNLSGGILAWLLEGGNVYDDKGQTRRVHVYGEKWNFVPDGYEAVFFGFMEQLLN